MLLVGCSTPPQKECVQLEPEIVYRETYKEIPVPVKCEVPEITCEFKGKGFVPTTKLLECVSLQKRALEYCSK